MRVREDYRSLSGPEKAAILLMSLGEEHASKMFALMSDDEIKEISQIMANLGTVSANVVERLFVEFAEQISSTGSTSLPPFSVRSYSGANATASLSARAPRRSVKRVWATSVTVRFT